ncbi:hypothetical protein EIN_381470 [Entamoeba invadens IP1]|uniref:Uncharacterized protein n=1 Tax=Entamoeba invadens IP1 TaxID=370355 RepID=A0A0A1UB07_ENTIV|nr:hypothetical protein EIN_381470 [Entamoeba invadens IP1]ELP92180.1 hypothetical protein EIN_381470 [Entamoeba invadens IP1]|eukprot:XP_004258951.1 hypothetical protein EIN_381470 [Entamoeba invadens IP1]
MLSLLVLFAVLGDITMSAKSVCECTVLSDKLYTSNCVDEKGEKVPSNAACVYTISTPIDAPIELENVDELRVKVPSRFNVRDVVINKLVIEDLAVFTRTSPESKLQINQLVASKAKTVTFSTDTFVLSSDGFVDVIVSGGSKVLFSGQINRLTTDGSFSCVLCKVNELEVQGPTEITMNEVDLKKVILKTSNFHLFSPQLTKLDIKELIVDMKSDYLQTLSLIHSASVIPEDMIKTLKVVDTKNNVIKGTIKRKCQGYEVFFVTNSNNEVICHPITCVYKFKGFNMKSCPMAERNVGDSLIPANMIIEEPIWDDKWSALKYTNVIFKTQGKGLNLQKKEIKTETLTFETGKYSLENAQYNGIVVKSGVVLNMTNVIVDRFESKEAQLVIDEVIVVSLLDFKANTVTMTGNLNFGSAQSKEVVKAFFDKDEVDTDKGKFLMQKKTDFFVEEISIMSSVFPVIEDFGKGKMYFEEGVYVTAKNREGDGCVMLADSNQVDAITLKGTNLVLDQNHISAYWCSDAQDIPPSFITCDMKRSYKKNGVYTIGSETIKNAGCEESDEQIVSYVFEEDDVVVNFEARRVGRVEAKKITFKTQLEQVELDEINAKEITFDGNFFSSLISIQEKGKCNIKGIVSFDKILCQTEKTEITVEEGSFLESTGDVVDSLKIVLKSKAAFHGYGREYGFDISNTDFDIANDAIVKVNSECDMNNVNIKLGLLNQHAVNLYSGSLKNVNVFLVIPNSAVLRATKKNPQYLVYSEKGITIENFNTYISEGIVQEATETTVACNGHWILANLKTSKAKCISKGINIRGKDTFTEPERWSRKKTTFKWTYIIVAVPVLAAVVFIIYSFCKTSKTSTGQKTKNILED